MKRMIIATLVMTALAWTATAQEVPKTYKTLIDGLNAKRAEMFKMPESIAGDREKQTAFNYQAQINFYCMRIEAIEKYIAANGQASDIWDAKLGLAESQLRLGDSLKGATSLGKDATCELMGAKLNGSEAETRATDLSTKYRLGLEDVAKNGPVDSMATVLAKGLLWKEHALGAYPIGFEENDINGKLISPATFHGKVLLLDFWATWCGPCVAELPNVQKAFELYHDKGLEILSISLDRTEDDVKYRQFIKDKKMDWYHIYDGKYWDAKLAKVYGVRSIPTMYVVGRDGKISSVSPRGENLLKAIEEAINKG